MRLSNQFNGLMQRRMLERVERAKTKAKRANKMIQRWLAELSRELTKLICSMLPSIKSTHTQTVMDDSFAQHHVRNPNVEQINAIFTN